ncbi:MAG: hypothetical protein MUC42_08090, partial [Bryobacter sp.]|nr:hypothetical protein [Bryobacter sp.]
LFVLLAADAAMQPYEMDWRAQGPYAVDLTYLNEAPAGKHGFVGVADGHLVDGRGRRLRIWGVNTTGAANLPSREDAPLVAAHLARFGINCVRMHFLDSRAPRGLIDATKPDSRHLDPAMVERLDWFVYQLKQRGIYTNLNLNVGRIFQPGDGVVDAGKLGFAKAITIFDEKLIELQMEFTRQLLTHRNPHTRTEYRNEPAVAIVELLNENSLLEAWVRGRLIGKGMTPGSTDQTWVDTTEHYARLLDRMFGGPRLTPDQFKSADPERFRKEAAFYAGLERSFYERMSRFLKKDLGVRVPVVGTSAHAGAMTPYPLLSSTSVLDIVDTHVYWQHPRYFPDPKTGRRSFDIRNTPMVNEPEKSAVVTLHRSAMAGRPFTVSEVNEPYPNEWAAEMIPTLAVYGSFLNWDGIFWYTFEHAEAKDWTAKIHGHFDLRQDPVKMTQLASGAIMFRRGDAAPARKTIERSYSREQVLDSLRLPASAGPNFTAGMPDGLALVHDARIRGFEKSTPSAFPPVSAPYRSDTGELHWSLHQGRGKVEVNTPRAKAVIGFHGNSEIENPFTALVLVSMDGMPLAQSRRALLTTGARAHFRGTAWNEKRTSLLQWGSPPMEIEPVQGNWAAPELGAAKKVMLQPVDGGGRAFGPVVAAKRSGQTWTLPLGAAVTPWYVVTIER